MTYLFNKYATKYHSFLILFWNIRLLALIWNIGTVDYWVDPLFHHSIIPMWTNPFLQQASFRFK